MSDGFARRFGGAALVTGASAGIGASFARALAQRGMDLVLVARRVERLEALGSELSEAHGVRAEALAADLTEDDAAERLLRATEERGLAVGLLVNNAGFGAFGPFAEMDPERARRMIDLNCRAPVALTHAFLPAMRARGRGGLVFVASTASYQPTPWMAVYGATKAFDLMIAEALWVELAGTGIEVIALSPGNTRTEFHDIAGVHDLPALGGSMDADAVVERALRRLGRGPSTIPGALNRLAAWSTRLLPRGAVARAAGRVNHPSKRGPDAGGGAGG